MTQKLLHDAVRIARKAGAILMEGMGSDFTVEYKGEVDLVTEMDRRAQELIESEVRSLYPHHGLMGEEGLEDPGAEEYLWVIDPLDGTTNYAHRFPIFSVSIGVAHGDHVLCGVVHNPVSEETFTAVRNGGAFLNGQAIAVSNTDALNRSLLATGFPYDIRQSTDNNLDHFANMAVLAQGIRRCGSAALDLCYVACGRVDGFWELNLKPWDIAAGILIILESGGKVSDFNGSPIGLNGSRVLASNGIIHEEMARVLTEDPSG